MKTKLKFSFGKRAVNTKKFYFFYCPMLKSTMEKEKIIFFWWIGPYYWTCQKAR